MDKEDQIASFLHLKKQNVLFFIFHLVVWSKILRAGHIDQSLFDPSGFAYDPLVAMAMAWIFHLYSLLSDSRVQIAKKVLQQSFYNNNRAFSK